jgi:hypothetical protein
LRGYGCGCGSQIETKMNVQLKLFQQMESNQASSTGMKMKRKKAQLELNSTKINNFTPLLNKTLVELIHQAGLCLTIFCLTITQLSNLILLCCLV